MIFAIFAAALVIFFMFAIVIAAAFFKGDEFASEDWAFDECKEDQKVILKLNPRHRIRMAFLRR